MPHLDRQRFSCRTWTIFRLLELACGLALPSNTPLAATVLVPRKNSSNASLESTVSSSAFRSRSHVWSSKSCPCLVGALRLDCALTSGGFTILDVPTCFCSTVWYPHPALSMLSSSSSPLSSTTVRLALFSRDRAVAIFADTGSVSSGSVPSTG